MGLSLPRVGRFVRAHLPWLLLGPVVTVFGTLVHESAHALAAKLSGATQISMTVVPSSGDADVGFYFGLVRWSAPWPLDAWWISVAPALLAACLAAMAHVWLPEVKRPALGKLGYVLGLLVPLVDLSMGLSGGVLGRPRSDLFVLRAQPGWLAAIAVYLAAQLWASYPLFLRLFGPTLSRLEHGALVGLLLLSPWLRWALAAS